MSSNNQTDTSYISTLNKISERNYIKKLRTRTQNYSIATVLFFIAGLGLNSLDDFKKPNHFNKILNYTKPLVIFLSMPFGILSAINGLKLISAKDFPKFYANKTNILDYYHSDNLPSLTSNYPKNNSKTNSKKNSEQHPLTQSTLASQPIPQTKVFNPQSIKILGSKSPTNSP